MAENKTAINKKGNILTYTCQKCGKEMQSLSTKQIEWMIDQHTKSCE